MRHQDDYKGRDAQAELYREMREFFQRHFAEKTDSEGSTSLPDMKRNRSALACGGECRASCVAASSRSVSW
jgi:hypothetical protein